MKASEITEKATNLNMAEDGVLKALAILDCINAVDFDRLDHSESVRDAAKYAYDVLMDALDALQEAGMEG